MDAREEWVSRGARAPGRRRARRTCIAKREVDGRWFHAVGICSNVTSCPRDAIRGWAARKRATHPRRCSRLVATVVVALHSVMPAGLHAALPETGVRSCRDMDHCDRASRGAPCRRARRDRRVRHVSRWGNPLRRLLVRSKGVERVEIQLPVSCHTNLAAEGSKNLRNPVAQWE
jgi:hypothetical protein